MAQYDNTTAEYRYFVVNLVTNQQIAEIPFKGVSYQRALKGAGSFSGEIAINDATEHLQLYESTMPGRTALYVVRDGVCVWGGIIWSRSYNVNDRVLSISGSEFTSYLYHRRIWKTWGQTFQATLTAKDGFIDAELSYGSTYALEPGSTIRYVFYNASNFIYNGYYTILDSPSPTESTFRTTNLSKAGTQAVPNGVYENATVYAKTNTYDYVRTLIQAVASDFAGIDFPNDEIEPARKTTLGIVSREIGNNAAIITVDSPAEVVPGQEVEVRNVAPELDGLHTISTVSADGRVISIANYPGTLIAANVSPQLYRATSWESSGGLTTVTTNAAHGLFVGQTITVNGLDPLSSTGSAYDTTTTVVAIPNATTFSYNSLSSDTVLALELSAPTAQVNNTFFLTRQEIETIGSNTVSTLTTGEPHDFQVGQTVDVEGFKDYNVVTRTSASTSGGITYTTAARHYYQVGNPVTVTGLADTANITYRAATRNTTANTTTFSITTATAHNLVTGNNVTVSGMVDSYSIKSYQYFSSNNILRLTTTANTNININNSQSITVSGMSSRTVGVTNVSRSGSTVTITTNTAHGLAGGQSVTIANFSYTYSVTINSLSRVSNVTTARTSTPHGFTSGQTININAVNAPNDFSESGVSINVVDDYRFTYSNPVAPTVTPDTTETSYLTGTATLRTVESYFWKTSGGSFVRVTSSGDEFNNYKWLYPNATGVGQTVAKRSAFRFDSLSTKLPAGVSISNVTAVTSATMTLTRASGVGFTGALADFAISTDGDLTNNSSGPPSRISGTTSLATTNWSLTQTRTLSLPSNWYPHIANGTAKTVLVGLASDGWVDTISTTNRIIAFIGRGNTSDTLPTNPRLTVNYTYSVVTGVPGQVISSDDDYSSSSAATATETITGINGSYTASVINETSFSYNSSQSSPNFTRTSSISSVTVNSGTNPFNGTYTSAELVARTANTIDINKSVSVGNVASTTTSGTITTPSNFNGTYNVTYVSPTSVSWTVANTSSYMYVNVAASNSVGTAIVLSADFNVSGRTITGVTNTTFTVSNPNNRVKADSAVTPQGVAVSDSPLVGTYEITAVTSDSFKYNVGIPLSPQTGTPIYGYANVSSSPTLTYGTYGPYGGSSDVDIEFSTQESLGSDVPPIEFRGFEVRNVGEELDKYTDIIDGFDYRIDCYIDPDTGNFSRQFVFLPIIPAAVKEYKENELEAGEAIPIRLYGADRLVFEFPGNISDLQLEESAENSATRFFMVGNIGDLGDDISQPYAVASATDLLNPPSGSYPWPILDEDESSEDIEDENTLYDYAERYLLENRPPEGKFTVSVNGSLEPVLGSYAPGDWCALIINDAFIGQRLSSELEPRNTVLLRKINSMNVSVPDSVTFPERIELELIPEWQVDQRGQ